MNNALVFKWFFTEEMGNTPIDMILDDARSVNALRRNGINTAEELADHWSCLGDLRNLGKRSIKLIHAAFFPWYLSTIEGTTLWSRFIDSMSAHA